MKALIALAATLLLVGCASVNKVSNGTHTVGERMTMNIDGAWNHLDFPGIKPAQIWSMEGITVDELMVFSGIADGQAIHPEAAANSKQKDFRFRRDMKTEEIAALFEGMLTRDGSLFKLVKLEPYRFGGKSGLRFEYERTRKIDNVQQRGVGFAAVDRGELFALLYHAPRLTFFPRHQARVESLARGIVIKG